MSPKVLKVLVALMRYLPVEMVSNFGAYMGRRRALKAYKKQRLWVARFFYNLEVLAGVKNEQEKKQRLIEFGEEFGRLYAETTVMRKIEKQNRVEFTGIEHLEGLKTPCIFVAPHYSNWEILLKVSAFMDNRTCDLYEPREDAYVMQSVYEARKVWSERLEFLSTSTPNAMREMHKKLKDNVNLIIFADEEKDGLVRAPLLGRKLDYMGNRWMLSRLAVKFEVDVVPLYVERVGPARFRVHVHNRIDYQKGKDALYDKRGQAMMIADELDKRMEEIIRQAPQLWYWLPYLKL